MIVTIGVTQRHNNIFNNKGLLRIVFVVIKLFQLEKLLQTGRVVPVQ